MRILILILLLSTNIQAQRFKYEGYSDRDRENNWTTKIDTGSVEITKDSIKITGSHRVSLEVITRQRFIRQDEEIYICYNEVRARLSCSDIQRRYFELSVYQGEFMRRYCLIKKE